ncbi:MAG: hypothetical protein AABX00_06885 [Nanoarchaeota archaeon]|mgnify:CR=1 FL=1
MKIPQQNSKLENISYVPLGILRDRSVTPLEAIVVYFKNLGFSFKEISLMINRDPRTVWTVYQRTTKKKKGEYSENNSKLENISYIPLRIFKNRSVTALEAIILYLKDSGFSFKEISLLINRDQRTVWTVHQRAVRKGVQHE